MPTPIELAGRAECLSIIERSVEYSEVSFLLKDWSAADSSGIVLPDEIAVQMKADGQPPWFDRERVGVIGVSGKNGEFEVTSIDIYSRAYAITRFDSAVSPAVFLVIGLAILLFVLVYAWL